MKKDISMYKGYGVATSDAEGGWDEDFKRKIKKTAQKTVLQELNFPQKFKLLYQFGKEKKRAFSLDLSDIHAKGMKNERFLKQQLEYIAMFSALSKVTSNQRAMEIMFKVMDKTAAEALLQSSPTVEEIKEYGDPIAFFRAYLAVAPQAATKAGCHDMVISESNENAIQFDIHWCVWHELAKRMGVPNACIPNCYADDLAYPEYFKAMGIHYSRKGTLAKGQAICDFRFERVGNS